MNKGQVRQSGSVLLSGLVGSDTGPSQPLMNRHQHTLSTKSIQEPNSKKKEKKIYLLHPIWEEKKEVQWRLGLFIIRILR